MLKLSPFLNPPVDLFDGYLPGEEAGLPQEVARTTQILLLLLWQALPPGGVLFAYHPFLLGHSNLVFH